MKKNKNPEINALKKLILENLEILKKNVQKIDNLDKTQIEGLKKLQKCPKI